MTGSEPAARRPKLVGVNHIALEVGDIDAALDFYGKIFDFKLRSRSKDQAFIDMGDQFIALMATETPHEDQGRHFGVVVDDRTRVEELAEAAGARHVPGPFMDFLDPWGNRFEVVEYGKIQFTKAPHVLRGMGLALDKTESAIRELKEKGMAP